MTLVNFVSPLRIGVEGQGAFLVSAAYGTFEESALAQPKARRSFRIMHFIQVGEGASVYRLPDHVVIEVLDSQLASIQGGITAPQWSQSL